MAVVSRARLAGVALLVAIGPTALPLSSAPMTLENTYWKLTRIGKEAVPRVRREPHLMLESKEKRASGFSGCNQFTGRYTVTGRRLTFQRISSTRMACLDPAEMKLEKAVLAALERARSWRIDGNYLLLLDRAGTALARFEAGVHKDRSKPGRHD